ncbi:multicopper oxidase family protein [Microlunatus sp. Gsoil 973]|uniref:multicopper oxidase family protein n=1 Tax=Microlunatus sp. Gsoil 973 TaxID=2672569 RepID=UPI0012B4903E|nr:multicopper oxidase family protein [Microlunatus sp. Gsoil 973]QGN31605.1 multicopper oxidase domain-containing protein [Microlunatus sp. Gsoil 973]
MRRRTLFGLAGAGLAGMAVGPLAGCADSPAGQSARLLHSSLRLPRPYQVPMPIPPVKKPVATQAGVTSYEIVQRTAEVEMLPGLRTTIMGYDGIFPGPTIEARRGERVVVRHKNQLPVPSVVHLHGGNTAPASDGYPIDLVLPRHWDGEQTAHDHGAMRGDVALGEREYHYDHDQQAATLWYHDHRMDFTGPQVWRGMAGFHLIRDDVEDELPLPHGDREIPLMITDRAFKADGNLHYPALDPRLISTPGVTAPYASGVLGDVILVNGAPWPELEVDAARYRFRILNASNARRYQLQLDPPPPGDGRGFTVIGTDGGLLSAPVRLESITTASAERHDVIIDFSRYPVGSEVVLANRLGSGSTATVMRFRVARKARDDSRIPATLTELEPLDTSNAIRREWRFTRKPSGGMTMWAINGRFFDPGRMDARPQLGRTEIWRFYTDLNHSVHVHLSPFRVISRTGHRPEPVEAGWKDTLDLRPTEYADVAVRFTNHRGHYLMHCHNLEHEDMGMMSAFEVV